MSRTSQYLDLAEVVSRGTAGDSYTDFEGLAPTEPVEALLANPAIVARLSDDDALPELRDLLAHYAYENLDQAGHELTEEEALAFIEATAYVLGCRRWMRVQA